MKYAFCLFTFSFCILFLSTTSVFAKGNLAIPNFQEAKKILYQKIHYDHRYTLYCNYHYEKNRKIALPSSFTTPAFPERAVRVEAEHIVPAENFGRTFSEWREGAKGCISESGKPFKGRKCAELVNPEFMKMEADLHNLYPAVGAVNALRSNFNFQMLGDIPNTFGSCQMKIEGRKVEPPVNARGIIARAYLYMEKTYPRYSMSRQQRQLMSAWDTMYPPNEWECLRNKRIAAIQGNGNEFIERSCP